MNGLDCSAVWMIQSKLVRDAIRWIDLQGKYCHLVASYENIKVKIFTKWKILNLWLFCYEFFASFRLWEQRKKFLWFLWGLFNLWRYCGEQFENCFELGVSKMILVFEWYHLYCFESSGKDKILTMYGPSWSNTK